MKSFRTRSMAAMVLLSLATSYFSGCRTVEPSQPSGVAIDRTERTTALSETVSTDRNIIFGDPVVSTTIQRLENVGYTVGYSPEARTPLWVSYHLFRVGDVASPPRDDLFAADPRVPNPVTEYDYANSGYDRGHLAPSSPIGRRYGKAAQDATFKMTNMCPQVPGLNQRGWEALERIISTDWAERFEKLWVIAGPIFRGDCKQLLSGVRVPSDCYMVIVYKTPQSQVRALGVVMPQRRINREPLADYVVAIDEIEAMTGIDFLKDLPDQVEAVIEAKDRTSADASWDINQLLKPTFAGTSRPIRVKDCN